MYNKYFDGRAQAKKQIIQEHSVCDQKKVRKKRVSMKEEVNIYVKD